MASLGSSEIPSQAMAVDEQQRDKKEDPRSRTRKI